MRVSGDTSAPLSGNITQDHSIICISYQHRHLLSLLPFPRAFLVLQLSAVLLLLLPVVSVALQDGRDGHTADTAGSEHTQGVRGVVGQLQGGGEITQQGF